MPLQALGLLLGDEALFFAPVGIGLRLICDAAAFASQAVESESHDEFPKKNGPPCIAAKRANAARGGPHKNTSRQCC